jgi:hypothetical protein
MIAACKQDIKPVPADYELAGAWADLTNYITRTTPANSPTFSSRCFGYIGLTMYESVVGGDSTYQSVASQLNGLGKLPGPEPQLQYIWPVSFNAAQAEIIRSIYIQTSDENKRKIDSLENDFLARYSQSGKNKDAIDRSVLYGKKIASLIFEWSKSDGGHRGYLSNFDKTLKVEEKRGSWKPPLYAQSFSHYPLHPHWGKNRTFLTEDSAIPAPAFIRYDSLSSSDYYSQFREVMSVKQNLTEDQKRAAIWWSDDPDVTFTPPGHSYQLARIAVTKSQASLMKCAETFARVGMAVADAFRNCWKWKYDFYSERPNTFITENIDPHWESFWPDPPFPAYPSGHAIQAAATATVLTDLYGDGFKFTDSSHVGRPVDDIRGVGFVERHFNSFWEAAEETAMSRLYGGIHTRQDNESGMEKGRIIGGNINSLKWRKR